MQTDVMPATPQTSLLRSRPIPGGFRMQHRRSGDRSILEARVRSGFGRHFGACVEGFMPELAIYQHANGSTAVVGVRSASDEPLFLEHYLDRPIDAEIRAVTGRYAPRDSIAEIGQFVIDDRITAFDFFADLVPFLSRQGYEWVCFTATIQIRKLLARIGFYGLPIAKADRARISDSGDHWGSYYDNDPMVIVGNLSDPYGGWCLDNAGSSNDSRQDGG